MIAGRVVIDCNYWLEWRGVESVEWDLVGLSGLKWCPSECSARVGGGLRGWRG